MLASPHPPESSRAGWWPRLLLVSLASLATVACGNSLYLRAGFDSVPEPATPAWRLVLLGDGGDDNAARTAVLAAASDYVAEAPERTTIIWLGDNLYSRGLPADDETDAESIAERQRGELVLRAQMELGTAGGRAYFVPGNHDWDRSGRRGLARVRAADRFIATGPASRQAPPDGCPGPVWVDLEPGASANAIDAPTIRLLFIDTEWLLTTEHARGWEGCSWGRLDAGSEYAGVEAEPAQVYGRLVQGLREADEHELLTVVAGHHPIYTAGSHGGFFPLDEWIFSPRMLKKWAWIPIPVLGPLLRRIGGASRGQDLWAASNKEMVSSLQNAFASYPPLLYAAGHEHDLQVFRDRGTLPTTYAISGSASKSTPTSRRDNTLFKSRDHGFMVLEASADSVRADGARLRVVAVDKESGRRRVPFCADLFRRRPAAACDGS